MAKRYKIKTVGHVVQIQDTHNFNRVVNTYDLADCDDAELELNELNNSYEIRAEIIQVSGSNN